MANLKVGIIGMGFIGMAHLDALRRIGGVEVTALARGSERAKALAAAYGVPRVYETADELIRDPEIQVIHNCTPNHLHLEINEKIIRAGKHVFQKNRWQETLRNRQKWWNCSGSIRKRWRASTFAIA